jgi:hypothetical protein
MMERTARSWRLSKPGINLTGVRGPPILARFFEPARLKSRKMAVIDPTR